MERDYESIYNRLLQALKESPDEQQALLRMTDEAFAFLDEAGEALTDEQYLSIKVLLGEAETRLARYFGM